MTGLRGSVWLFMIIVTIGFADVKAKSEITNGSTFIDADITEYPWQAGLYKHDYRFIASATIISEQHILTTADVVHQYDNKYRLNAISIAVGKKQLNRREANYKVEEIIVHPEYRWEINSPHNLAILKLKRVIEFDENKKPVQLATKEIANGTAVTITGWELRGYGPTYADHLVKHDLMIEANNVCDTIIYNTDMNWRSGLYVRLNDDQICAVEPRDSGEECLSNPGNPGSPLLHGNTLVGIKSWSLGCIKRQPIIFTRIYSYVDWINDVIDNC